MTATKARAEKVNFSTPYGDASLVAATLAGNDAIKAPDDLAGKTVGVLLGTNTVDFAKKLQRPSWPREGKPPLTVKTYDDFPSMLVELTNKNIDALMLPHPIMGGYMAQKPGTFKVIDGPGRQILFRRRDPQGRHERCSPPSTRS